MSVRAYRVIKLIMDAPGFNLWHNENLAQFLDEEGQFFGGRSDGTGLVDVPEEILESALEEAAELELSPKTVQCLRKDIAAARSKKDDSVTYYCF